MMYIYIMFGGGQVDVVGIYVVDFCYIDCVYWCCIDGGQVWCDLCVIGVDCIEFGCELDLFGLQCCMYVYCMGDDVGICGVIGLQVQFFKVDYVVVDVIVFQVVLLDDGCVGGYGGVLGVDEIVVCVGDVGRVGDDYLCWVVCYFDEVVQVVGVCCVDLVDDDLCVIVGYLWIVSDIVVQFGFVGVICVIEDDFVFIYIKMLVVVD